MKTLFDKTTWTGEIEYVRYYNEENGFCIMTIFDPDTWQEAAVKGTVSIKPQKGLLVEVKGDWENNPKYGMQFKMSSCTYTLPKDILGISKYLSSGIIPGIGPKTADSIVSAFKGDTFEILDKNPKRVMDVNGIGKKKAALIARCWKNFRNTGNLMAFLQGHGISSLYAERINRTLAFKTPEETEDALRKNPYLLLQVEGIGFRKADQFAASIGCAPDHPERIKACLLYSLKQILMSSGSTCTSFGQLVKSSVDELAVRAPEGSCGQIKKLCEKKLTELSCQRDPSITVSRYPGRADMFLSPFELFKSESNSATGLRALTARPNRRPPSLDRLEQFCRMSGKQLTEEQKNAIIMACTRPVSVITGGPGTGKTTLLQALLYASGRGADRICLAAPTGRAAKRIEETIKDVVPNKAQTLHRLFNITPSNDFNNYVSNIPDCDTLIIDESSMIDQAMFDAIVYAAECGKFSLVFVGDADQLPSVGPGNVLADLISSGTVPVARLRQVFRQSKGSPISAAAQDILGGVVPDGGQNTKGFSFIETETGNSDSSKTSDTIFEIVKREIKNKRNPYTDIQVLAPMHAGAVGTEALNEKLMPLTVKKNAPAVEILGRKYFVGEKVIQLENNYSKDIYNGDIGIVTEVLPEQRAIEVQFQGHEETTEFLGADVDSLRAANAMTVHKSQGMEYPVVVIPVVNAHYNMLFRKLLYTAVTRASEQVYIVGSRTALAKMVANDRASTRQTLLGDMLKGHFPVVQLGMPPMMPQNTDYQER